MYIHIYLYLEVHMNICCILRVAWSITGMRTTPMYICIYVYICMYMYIHIYVYIEVESLYIYIYLCICIYVYIYMCVFIEICLYLYLYTYFLHMHITIRKLCIRVTILVTEIEDFVVTVMALIQVGSHCFKPISKQRVQAVSRHAHCNHISRDVTQI